MNLKLIKCALASHAFADTHIQYDEDKDDDIYTWARCSRCFHWLKVNELNAKELKQLPVGYKSLVRG